MKCLLVFAVLTLLPAWGWGQHRAAVAPRPVALKPETKQARYARLDEYARLLPEAQAATLEKLAASLGAQARSDDDKARLIFAWLAYHVAYDGACSSRDTTNYYQRSQPAAVLQNRKAVCKGYADLFTKLAAQMELEAVTIDGHSRIISDAGNLLDEAKGHAWNAYRIAGTWHLADATWAAGGTMVTTNEFVFRFEPFWFDTPPAQMIFRHLPDSVAWQLLPVPATAADFQRWPYVANEWFQLLSGESMRKALSGKQSQTDSLPVVQASPHHVTLIQAPKCGKLVANQPVKFIFAVPAGVEIFIVTDTSSVPLQAAGGYWQATITPVAGNVWVLAQRKDDYTTGVNVLKYQIIPALAPARSPGQHPTIIPNNVVYLRP